MSDTERRLRERAYQLWEQAGRPDDGSDAFWFAAVRESEGGEAPRPGDRPGEETDFPPAERTLEDSATLSVTTGVPGEVPDDSLATPQSTVAAAPRRGT